MDWTETAKLLFNAPKPEHFANHLHCCECAEHDQTLLSFDVDSIGLSELGNPGWDPICFASIEGKKYYLPALIRLTVETIDNPRQTYLEQLLFHLIRDGPDNDLIMACSKEQRAFVAAFLEFLIEHHTSAIDECYADQIIRAHDIWNRETGE